MAKPGSKAEKDDRASAREMVRTVVMAQGNIFIRDLLRRKKIAVGVRKEQFEANLLKAIDDGQITRADVAAWLGEVEGWGDQSVKGASSRGSLGLRRRRKKKTSEGAARSVGNGFPDLP